MVRSIPYAEADLVVTVFSETLGLVPVLARGARSYRKGAPSSLEPLHTLRLELGDRQGADLLSLRAAAIAVARPRLAADLDCMQAAGQALRWLRQGLPPRTPEPETWSEINRLLDTLDSEPLTRSPLRLVAEFGIRLLATLGYALHLDRCVVCGRSCQPGRAAYVDPSRGGIVCSQCGGASRLLDGSTRDRLLQAARGGEGVLLEADAGQGMELVDAMLRAHVGIEPEPSRRNPCK
ncbi:MAG: DNA repair protein RecO [Deltaproteobacteria bacterium]|nr:DNA repair protein RecO [Deltaproteobacteria bacterium]